MNRSYLFAPKRQARGMVAEVLTRRSAWVRINAARTDDAAADLDAVTGL